MESIGDKLRTSREQKGNSIEQVARETNIAKRYLEALEAEEFSVFPGEPYLIGFLRNYADYLGIDPEEMVTLYRNFKIQSQPLPMDELLVKHDYHKLWLILAIVVVVVGLGVGGYYLVPYLSQRGKAHAAVASEATASAQTGQTYQLTGEILERRFVQGDTIDIPLNGKDYTVKIASIGDNVTLTVPGGTNVLRVGDERAIDLNGDAKMDVTVSVTDIDTKSKEHSAVLRLDRFVKQVASASGTNGAGSSTTSGSAASPSGTTGSVAAVPFDTSPVNIVSSETAAPFTVNIVFQGYCLLRYLVDGKDREERYFDKGETLDLNVSKQVSLWLSNGGSLTARIAGQDVQLGKPGEVSAETISWVMNDQGSGYELVMTPLL